MELQKITSFWRVSKDYDKLSLGDENGFLCEMVGQGSAQVLGENGLPKWPRVKDWLTCEVGTLDDAFSTLFEFLFSETWVMLG